MTGNIHEAGPSNYKSGFHEEAQMDPDVTKVTEIFLSPTSIMVGALGVAHTEGLKTGVSLIGLVSSCLWLACNINALDPNAVFRVWVLALLPILFLVLWLVSAAYHGYEFYKERDYGKTAPVADAAAAVTADAVTAASKAAGASAATVADKIAITADKAATAVDKAAADAALPPTSSLPPNDH